jgi:hypothetical protein
MIPLSELAADDLGSAQATANRNEKEGDIPKLNSSGHIRPQAIDVSLESVDLLFARGARDPFGSLVENLAAGVQLVHQATDDHIKGLSLMIHDGNGVVDAATGKFLLG